MAKRIRVIRFPISEIKLATEEEQKQVDIDSKKYTEPDEETKQYYLEKSIRAYEGASEVEVIDLSGSKYIEKK